MRAPRRRRGGASPPPHQQLIWEGPGGEREVAPPRRRGGCPVVVEPAAAACPAAIRALGPNGPEKKMNRIAGRPMGAHDGRRTGAGGRRTPIWPRLGRLPRAPAPLRAPHVASGDDQRNSNTSAVVEGAANGSVAGWNGGRRPHTLPRNPPGGGPEGGGGSEPRAGPSPPANIVSRSIGLLESGQWKGPSRQKPGADRATDDLRCKPDVDSTCLPRMPRLFPVRGSSSSTRC